MPIHRKTDTRATDAHPVGEKERLKHLTVERRMFTERPLYDYFIVGVHRQRAGVFQRQNGLFKLLTQQMIVPPRLYHSTMSNSPSLYISVLTAISQMDLG